MVRGYIIAAALAVQALAAPRPQPAIIPRPHKVEARQASKSGSPPEFAIEDTPKALPSGPAGASGSLRGPTSLLGYSPGNPVNTQLPATVPKDQHTLAPGQSEDEDLGLYLDLSEIENPQPSRGGTDAPTDPGPRNKELEKQNSDLYAPPGTDAGDVPNAKWPLGMVGPNPAPLRRADRFPPSSFPQSPRPRKCRLGSSAERWPAANCH